MHRRLHGRAGYRKVAGVTVAAALGLAAVAACSNSGTTSGSTASNTGHVTVTGLCAPPSSSPVPYKEWNEDVERRQDGLPGAGGHARLAVEDPADRGLADPHLLGHLAEPPAGCARHACKYTASTRKYLRNLTHRIRQFSAERTGVLAALFRKSDAINVA